MDRDNYKWDFAPLIAVVAHHTLLLNQGELINMRMYRVVIVVVVNVVLLEERSHLLSCMVLMLRTFDIAIIVGS